MTKTKKSSKGPTGFHQVVTADGSSGFKAEAGRYHLYVSHACPWAHRTTMMRKLKGLEDAISLSIVKRKAGEVGWHFIEDCPDPNGGRQSLREVYLETAKDFAGTVSVPVLYDKVTKKIVNNESSEIIRIFNKEFNAFASTPEYAALDLYPDDLRAQIDTINEFVLDKINNSVYAVGFARDQQAYKEAFTKVFNALDLLECILGKQRYLVGDRLTEADVRLFVTLIRFDAVYVGLYKCNRQRIFDYDALRNYTQEIHQKVKDTVDIDEIKFVSYQMKDLNPFGIVPIGPDVSYLDQPHNRDQLFPAAV